MLKLPLRSGTEIDWRTKCHPGDSQGETGSCTTFAISNWAECMTGQAISDESAVETWRQERLWRYRDTDGGLQVTEAFAAAMIRARWMPHGTTLRRVNNLDTLPLAPLVVCFAGLDWALPLGKIIIGGMAIDSNHCVLAVADIEGYVWVENSHGRRWGQDGFGCMTYATFARHCVQIWQIILPGAPQTIAVRQIG